MGELLINNQAQEPEVRQTVPPWTQSKEFLTAKRIVPTNFARLGGNETTCKPEYRDKEGFTYRLTFIDLDNGEMERYYENSFKNFYEDVSEARVERGVEYKVSVAKTSDGKYKWSFIKAS